MRKKKSWEQAKSAANLRIGIIATIIGLLPTIGTGIAFQGMFAAMKPENRWSDYKERQEDSAVWNTASFTDETFGGFEEDLDSDFTFDDADEDMSWLEDKEVDITDAYDYDTNSDVAFDSSFVEDTSYAYSAKDDLDSSLRTAWGNWADGFELVSAWSFESTESLQEITDIEIQAFESSGLYLEDRDAFEDAVANALKTDAVGFTVMKADEYLVAVWCYDSAESWYTTGSTFELRFAQDFSETVSDMIDDVDVQVLLSMAPTELDAYMTASRLFNRFDDRVTADYATRWTDWEGFYTQFEKWESNLNEHSLGFICCNNWSTNTREYKALAYDARGNYIGETTYTTELMV